MGKNCNVRHEAMSPVVTCYRPIRERLGPRVPMGTMGGAGGGRRGGKGVKGRLGRGGVGETGQGGVTCEVYMNCGNQKVDIS